MRHRRDEHWNAACTGGLVTICFKIVFMGYIRIIALLGVWLWYVVPGAQAQVKPGEYVAYGGLGVLRVVPDKSAGLRFHLFVRGANFHMCDLSGVIRNGEARMEDSADDKRPCIVVFKPVKVGLAVESKFQGTCSTYCGARAHFEGEYQVPPADCAPSQVRAARNRFKTTYDKRQFAEARELLSPIVEKCASVVTELDDGWIRNDLALTQYHAGDRSACRAVLKPWLELAQMPDARIREEYPPSDGEEMLRLAGATRANMKLCGAPVAIGGKSAK